MSDKVEEFLESLDIKVQPASAAEIREYLGFWLENASAHDAAIRTMGFLDSLVIADE